MTIDIDFSVKKGEIVFNEFYLKKEDQLKTLEQVQFLGNLIIMNFEGNNMNWNDIDGNALFNKVFDRLVEINEIDIFDIKIDREAATVIISFDLVNELPGNPPPKWVKGYNRCRCGINCSGINFLKIEGMSTDMLAKIEIERHISNNEVIINGTDVFYI